MAAEGQALKTITIERRRCIIEPPLPFDPELFELKSLAQAIVVEDLPPIESPRNEHPLAPPHGVMVSSALGLALSLALTAVAL